MTAPDFAAILAAARQAAATKKAIIGPARAPRLGFRWLGAKLGLTSAEFSGRTVYSPPRAANHALATRVPALCPTCDGTTVTHNERHEWADISCPDCPTIGRLLAIGAAVMTSTVNVNDYTVTVAAEGKQWHPTHAIALRDLLLAVQP